MFALQQFTLLHYSPKLLKSLVLILSFFNSYENSKKTLCYTTSNSSAFGFLLQATPTFKVAYSEVGVALVLFTLSSMPNQQSDWAWGELLQSLSIHRPQNSSASACRHIDKSPLWRKKAW